MSLPRKTLLELMALADGELEGEAKERAEMFAARSDEARRVVEATRASVLREWLTEAMDRRAHEADGIADAVMSRLAAAEAPPPVGLAFVEGGADGLVRRVEADSRVRRSAARRSLSRRMVAAGGVVALAAGVAIYVRSATRGAESSPVASVAAPSDDTSGWMARNEGVRSARGVVVDEIDSPSSEVSIFQIPTMANASASSIVVWIDDEPGAR